MNKNFRTQVLLMSLSLIIAFVIWLIAKSGELSTDWVISPILFKETSALGNLEVTASRREVNLNVQFPLDIRSLVISKNLRTEIDLEKYFSGDPARWPDPTQAQKAVVRLRPGENIFPGPQLQSVKIMSTDPSEITLEAKLLNRELTVDVRTTGTLPRYYELTGGKLTANPQTLRVTGPRNALESLSALQNRIATKSINLSLIQASGPIFPELIVPEGVQLLSNRDGHIRVDVGLSEVIGTQTINQIPVDMITFDETLLAVPDPAVVNIVVRGPLITLEKLNADQFAVTSALELTEQPGQTQQVGLTASLVSTVSPEIAGRVTVLEVQPPRITVEFVKRNPEDSEGLTTGTGQLETTIE